MDIPPKKKPIQSINPKILFLGLFLLAGVIVAFTLFIFQKKPLSVTTPNSSAVVLFSEDPKNIASLTVAISGQNPYTLLQNEKGEVVLKNYESFPLQPTPVEEIFAFASHIEVEETLTLEEEGLSSQQVFDLHKSEFGLDSPLVEVKGTTFSGKSFSFAFGDEVPHHPSVFFTFNQQPVIYLLSKGFSDLYHTLDKELIFVPQPIIHGQRIHQITYQYPNRQVQLAAKGTILKEDGYFTWQMNSPSLYPLDPEKVSALLSHFENFHIGSFVEKATEQSLQTYGFSPPQLTLTINQQEATIGQVNPQGIFEQSSYPQSTFTLQIGHQLDPYTYYVLIENHIYLLSTLSLGDALFIDESSLLLKRPVLLPIETLSTLVEKNLVTQKTTGYTLSWNPILLKNNEFQKDEQGNLVTQLTVTSQEKTLDSVSFSTSYTALTQVAVTGFLPENFIKGPSHYQLILTTTGGITRTIELSAFDAVHDALTIDGVSLFYIPKNILQEAFSQLASSQSAGDFS